VTAPYWSDGQVTLYLGDCRTVTEWLSADVLVTDPPYGRKSQPRRNPQTGLIYNPDRIAGDESTAIRDAALELWRGRLGVVFGDLMLAPAPGTKKVLVYRKPYSGALGSINGFRHDIEAVYLAGPWPAGFGGQSSVLVSGARTLGNMQTGVVNRYGHPHAKPVDVMETLAAACPDGTIADPFTGSGSTLVAARNLGRRAIGVEIDERHAEKAARRLSQMVLTA